MLWHVLFNLLLSIVGPPSTCNTWYLSVSPDSSSLAYRIY